MILHAHEPEIFHTLRRNTFYHSTSFLSRPMATPPSRASDGHEGPVGTSIASVASEAGNMLT